MPKKRCKTNHIDLTSEQLICLRDTCPTDLMNLIIVNKWVKGFYTNDMEQNDRLRIVRFFYNKRMPIKNTELTTDKKGQTKLL